MHRQFAERLIVAHIMAHPINLGGNFLAHPINLGGNFLILQKIYTFVP